MRHLLRFALSAEGIRAYPKRAARCREGWVVSRAGKTCWLLFDDLDTPAIWPAGAVEISDPPLTLSQT